VIETQRRHISLTCVRIRTWAIRRQRPSLPVWHEHRPARHRVGRCGIWAYVHSGRQGVSSADRVWILALKKLTSSTEGTVIRVYRA
jgi:hypothetical protein